MEIDTDPGGEKKKDLIEVRLYRHAQAIAMVANEILKEGDAGSRFLSTGEHPQDGSARLGFLASVYRATVANNPNVGVPGGLEDEQLGQVISVLLAMGKTEEEIRAQLLESNPAWTEVVNEKFASHHKHSGDIGLGVWEYVKALRCLNWDDERLDEPMDESVFYLLINQCVERSGRSAESLVVANSQPELMVKWLQDCLIKNGDEAAYRFVALLAEQFKGENAAIYPKVKEIAAALPSGSTAALIGRRLIREGEYRPPEFSLTGQELSLLANRREFSLDEIYDIACRPVLRHAMFIKTPRESDPELGEMMESGVVGREGINILEYLQYLIKTGGCFRQGSTAVLGERLDDFDETCTYQYLRAGYIWAEWRRIAQKRGNTESLQKVLDAWTLLAGEEQ